MAYIMNINERRAKIIKEARERRGLTPQQLADMLGVSRISVIYWEKGNPLKADNLERLSRVLDLGMAELQSGKNITKQEGILITVPKNIRTQLLPLLKFDEIDKWLQNPVVLNQYATINMPINNKKYHKNAFAFQNIGKSMISKTTPEESLFPGEISIVDPDRELKDGQLVLAKFGSDDYRVRQYREDGANKFLQAFNTEIEPTTLLNAGIKIVGVIVRSLREWD